MQKKAEIRAGLRKGLLEGFKKEENDEEQPAVASAQFGAEQQSFISRIKDLIKQKTIET